MISGFFQQPHSSAFKFAFSDQPLVALYESEPGTPVDSIFAESPMPEPEPIVRPATVPKKKEKSLVAIKPNQFISYKAIENFCNKVEGL